ncbi:site-specific tyrosine recombinase XerC [compost metagenome]
MTSLTLKWIHRFRDRHGKMRHYFRRPGMKRVPLPGSPGSTQFMEAYQSALEAGAMRRPESRTKPGTIAAAIDGYFSSLEYVSLGSKVTKATYRRALTVLAREHGDKPIRLLEAHHIKSIMAQKIATPAAANSFLRHIRMVCNYAVDRGWITRNPAVGIKKIKYDTEGFHTWSESEIRKYEDFWPVGTTQRLAFDLLLHTGQRSADVRQMISNAISDYAVTVVAQFAEGADFKQQKTKAKVNIPITPELQSSLNAFRSRQGTIILTSFGKPFTEKGFSNYISDAATKAGLPNCTAHGLRKSAATRLAEANCTEAQIMAITGHKTSAEVGRYTKAARQKVLAQEAMGKLQANRTKR